MLPQRDVVSTAARVPPWLGTAGRLLLGGVWLYAGLAKVTDLEASVRAVNAYRLLPTSVAEVVGSALPFLEIGPGLLLVLGLATRVAAIASAVLQAAFIVGIIAAWARGMRIDCGCFGSGGQLAAGQSPQYLWDTLRDTGLFVVAVLLAVFPRTALSLDGWLLGTHGGEDT